MIGKKRDTATKRGRWYGSIAVLLFLFSGGSKLHEHWSEEWFAATLVLSVAWFVIGYLIGVTKGCLSNRKNRVLKSPRHSNTQMMNILIIKIPHKKVGRKTIKVKQGLKKNIPMRKD